MLWETFEIYVHFFLKITEAIPNVLVIQLAIFQIFSIFSGKSVLKILKLEIQMHTIAFFSLQNDHITVQLLPKIFKIALKSFT